MIQKILYVDISELRLPNMSSSAGNVNQQTARISYVATAGDPRVITKTHSASNVFTRTTNVENARNSLSTTDSYNKVQYPNKFSGDFRKKQFSVKSNGQNNGIAQGEHSGFANAPNSFAIGVGGKLGERYIMRRGSSVENMNAGIVDVNSNGNMKKIKYENEVIALWFYQILIM